MDRRTAGVLLLIMVAYAALIVPAIAGRKVVGSPVAAAVPRAPSVGDCVTVISALPPTDETAAPDVRVAYPGVEYGSCAGSIVGEVMSIDPTPHPLNQATVATYQQAKSACELSEVNYVGSIGPFDPATITTPGIAWQADVVVESIAIGPSAVQRAAGQSWTACVGATPYQDSYHGTISGALTDGVLPSVFATCWRSFMSSTEQQVAEQQVSCDTAHPIEIIALTQITDPNTTVEQVQDSCLGMASRALRTADPTRAGRLKIAAYSMDPLRLGALTRAGLADAYLACIASVDDPLRLTGTLIGIGSKPLPIVN